MRIIVILTIVFLVSGTETFAKKIKALIVRGSKSEEVLMSVRIPWLANEPSFEALQCRIKYFDVQGKKHILKPEDADEIRFEHNGMQVRMISVSNTIGAGRNFSIGRKIFLKLEIDGPLRLFRYYYRQSSPGMMTRGGGFTPGPTYTVDNLLFQKRNGPLKRPKGMGWKKDMLEYLSDCPALTDMIEGKEFKRRDVEAIVMFYNQHCGK